MNEAQQLQAYCEKLPGFFEYAMECFDKWVELTKRISTKHSLDPRVVYQRIQNANSDPEILDLLCKLNDEEDISE